MSNLFFWEEGRFSQNPRILHKTSILQYVAIKCTFKGKAAKLREILSFEASHPLLPCFLYHWNIISISNFLSLSSALKRFHSYNNSTNIHPSAYLRIPSYVETTMSFLNGSFYSQTNTHLLLSEGIADSIPRLMIMMIDEDDFAGNCKWLLFSRVGERN